VACITDPSARALPRSHAADRHRHLGRSRVPGTLRSRHQHFPPTKWPKRNVGLIENIGGDDARRRAGEICDTYSRR
jgi:hypothetical protein